MPHDPPIAIRLTREQRAHLEQLRTDLAPSGAEPLPLSIVLRAMVDRGIAATRAERKAGR